MTEGFYYDKNFIEKFKNRKFREFKSCAEFLLSLQNRNTGSWVSNSAPEWALIETNIEILSVLRSFGLKPKYKLKFLDKFREWNNISTKLNQWVVEDRNGSQRDYFNRGGTKLIRFYTLFPSYFSRKWYREYLKFFLKCQNPKTGYWGLWFRKGRRIIKKDDLSVTFHILGRFYRKDGSGLRNRNFEPKYSDKIIKTTWEIKNKEYPSGWLENGRLSEHHIMDVILIFTMLQKQLSDKEKNKIENLKKKIEKWMVKNLMNLTSKNFSAENVAWIAQTLAKERRYISQKEFDKSKKNVLKIIRQVPATDPISYLRIIKELNLEESEISYLS